MTFEYLETHPNIIVEDMFGTPLYPGDWVLLNTGGRASGASSPELGRLSNIVIKPKNGKKDLKLYPSLNITYYSYLFSDEPNKMNWNILLLKKEHNNYSNLSLEINTDIQVYQFPFAKVDRNVNEKLKDRYKELMETE